MKKLAIDSKHREYFNKNQTIEFEGLIAPNLLQDLKKDLQNDPKFESGRDLWRTSAAFKKLATNSQLAEIASELSQVKDLRLGLDQYFPAIPPYSAYFQTSPTLSSLCSIQGVVCGLLLCLEAPAASEEPVKFFGTQEGNGVFFLAQTPLALPELLHREGGKYLLIVYVSPNAVYIHEDQDPLRYKFKELGYNYGDKLNDKLNPMVHR